MAVSRAALRAMLRGLLAERFGLSLHADTEERPVYALKLIQRRQALQEVHYQGEDQDSGIRPTSEGLVAVHTSMPTLANMLSTRMIGLDRPVVDRTSLPGLFDFRLTYATISHSAAVTLPDSENTLPDIFTAVKELGLSLSPQKAALKVWVVDKVSRNPAPN